MRYVVTGEVTISCQLEVEANSEKEARAIAKEASMMQLCVSCSNGDEGCWSTSGELDGIPVIRTVNEESRRRKHR